MSDIGHNSSISSDTAAELRRGIEALERYEEEIKGINDDKKDKYAELRSRGFDPKIIRKLLAIRRKKKGEHEEEAMTLETYMAALGMI